MVTDLPDKDLLPKRKQCVLAPHGGAPLPEPNHLNDPLDEEIVIEDLLDADVLV